MSSTTRTTGWTTCAGGSTTRTRGSTARARGRGYQDKGVNQGRGLDYQGQGLYQDKGHCKGPGPLPVHVALQGQGAGLPEQGARLPGRGRQPGLPRPGLHEAQVRGHRSAGRQVLAAAWPERAGGGHAHAHVCVGSVWAACAVPLPPARRPAALGRHTRPHRPPYRPPSASTSSACWQPPCLAPCLGPRVRPMPCPGHQVQGP